MRVAKPTNLLTLLLLTGVTLYFCVGAYRLVRWNALPWMPSYIQQSLSNVVASETPIRHVIFTMVDHYEPGFDEQEAVIRNERWLDQFDSVATQHTDHYGNQFRYTWFYPYDQPHDAVMHRLNKSVRLGLGEVEFHWHHPRSNNASFPAQVQQAVAWFNRFGAMVSSKPPYRAQFAFVHGNWALDGSTDACGVSNEIAILQRYGGYMDMTFSTIGSPSQPRTLINSLYYVTDDDRPRSYETGTPVAVGRVVNDGFLIFQGPLRFGLDLQLEYGAVETYARPSRERVRKWIDTRIHVAGRPDWVFVKVYSHGIQSDIIVNQDMANMLDDVKRETAERGASLHYMTAREAYNVLKAAEAGLSGNPESYRDYVLAKPRNAIGATQNAALETATTTPC